MVVSIQLLIEIWGLGDGSSSGFILRVILQVLSNVSEEPTASIFKVKVKLIFPVLHDLQIQMFSIQSLFLSFVDT
jgi:hypothetical protein